MINERTLNKEQFENLLARGILETIGLAWLCGGKIECYGMEVGPHPTFRDPAEYYKVAPKLVKMEVRQYHNPKGKSYFVVNRSSDPVCGAVKTWLTFEIPENEL